MRLVDENGKAIKSTEEFYSNGHEDYLNTGDFIKGKDNRYRVVSKELDLTNGGGVRWNIYITIDNKN